MDAKRAVVLEIDQLIVPQDLMDHARAGSGRAKDILALRCNNIVCKMGHAKVTENEVVVSIGELAKMGIIKSIVVSTGDNATA